MKEPGLVVGIEHAATAVGRVTEQFFLERAVGRRPDRDPLGRVGILHHPELALIVDVEIRDRTKPRGVPRPGLEPARRADGPQEFSGSVVDPHILPVGHRVEHIQQPLAVHGEGRGLQKVGDQFAMPAVLQIDLHHAVGGECVEVAGRTERERARRREMDLSLDLPRAAVHDLHPLGRARVDRRLAAEGFEGGHAVDPAATQVERLTAPVAAHAAGIVVLRGPLLHHAEPHRPGRHFHAEVDVAVDVACVGVVLMPGLVVVAGRLLVGGHLPPALRSVDLHRAVPFEDIDLRPLAVDLLDRQPADRLRLFPFHHVDAWVGRRDSLVALRVPFTTRVDLAGVDPHRRLRQEVFESSPQELQALEAGRPDSFLVSFLVSFVVGGRPRVVRPAEVAELGPCAVVGQRVVEIVDALTEGEPQAAGDGLFGQRQHTPPAVVRAIGGGTFPNGGPVLLPPGVGRIRGVGLQHGDLEPQVVLRKRKHERADRHLLVKRHNDVVARSREVGARQPGQHVVAGRRSGEPQQPQEIGAGIGLVVIVRFPHRRIHRRAVRDVDVRGAHRIAQPVVGGANGEIHLSVPGLEAANAPAAGVGGGTLEDRRDGLRGGVDPPEVLLPVDRLVWRRGGIDRRTVARKEMGPRPGGEIVVAPLLAALQIALDHCHAALGARR